MVTQYFDEDPSVISDRRTVDVSLGDVAFTMLTDRGVFSHGHLDTGTSLLLREAAAPAPAGHLADIGCGSGALALAMAMRSPAATVWAIDVNARARELTALNAARNGVANVRVAAPTDVPDDILFATIWSNPPIRIGKQALHELLVGWLGRLTSGGDATLVVHRHLGADSLQRWLEAQGYVTNRRASKAGFRLLHCRREAPGPG